ncbi:MAG: hypothetical protein JOY62_01030 [Acidobacteriaceae bacterium]|nr:hypothetical protein [Acidobacteriaceae bacterium]MBV9778529.1 hypothetical protein [Acidobacteriaceae bacterium]
MTLTPFHRFGIWGLLVFAVAGMQALGQTSTGTSVDLQAQTRNADFSNFSVTLPMTVGTALPSSCQVGQFYFNTSATAGSNTYACTAANVWTVQGGGLSMSAQMGDFAPLLTGGSLTVGAGCSSSSPCNVRLGNTVHTFKNPAIVTPSGSNTGLVLVYIDNSGNLTAGSSTGLACNGCTYAPRVTAFPPDSIPLFNWTLTGGAFDAQGGTDFRALLSSKNVTSGTGILMSQSGGTSTIAVDPTVVGTQVPPPATSSDACSAGQFSFDTSYYYICTATNTWKRVALASF